MPLSKSMPKLRPLVESAIEPISRITPDIAKKSLLLPMKSKVQRRWRRPAPSIAGLCSSRVRPIEPRTACVNSTAVNSETIVPTPSVKAKPLTPEVARMKRMNAVISVTTFASMIVAIPRL